MIETQRDTSSKITIDPDLRDWIIPLTDNEKSELEKETNKNRIIGGQQSLLKNYFK